MIAHQLARALGSARSVSLVTGLTLILLVLYGGYFWESRIPIAIISSFALVFPVLLRHPRFWLVLTLLITFANVRRLYVVDNHKVLLAYWCFAVALALNSRRPRLNLAVSARLLIGLCFTFATFWKIMSHDFLDGTFFHYTLLEDSRFQRVGVLGRWLSPEMIQYNAQQTKALYSGDVRSVELSSTSSIGLLAQAMTIWTIVIEASIAATFMGSVFSHRSAFWRRVLAFRNMLLLMFLFSTYIVAPVVGFGWLLAIMGVAQCRVREPRARIAYVAAFVFIQLTLVPWWDVANEFLSIFLGQA